MKSEAKTHPGGSRAQLGQQKKARTNRSGQRHWYRITGLRGWRRKQLGVPAFGNADCVPPDKK